MTESEWHKSVVPHHMVDQIPKDATNRKRRLLGCGLCRRIWHLLSDERSRTAVEVAERFADGEVSAKELRVAKEGAEHARQRARSFIRERESFEYFGAGAAHWVTWEDLRNFGISDDIYGIVGIWEDVAQVAMTQGAKWHDELAAFCEMVRCVFGNPFREVSLDESWRTSDTLDLARAIYEDRAFDRMPILADALMDAGCDSEYILSHCRSSNPHVRGCWVVDQILEKR